MKILLSFLLFYSTFSYGDKGAEEGTKARCAQNFSQVERCCLQGQCLTSDNQYALTIDAEELRPLRHACFAARNEQAPTCPKGRHLVQQQYIYTGTEKDIKSDRITRLLLVSSQIDDRPPTKNKAVISLLAYQNKICLDEIADMIGANSANSESHFLNSCDDSYKPRFSELMNKIHLLYTDLLINPAKRLKSGEHYNEPVLNKLITEACPYIQKWNGVFEQEQLERLYKNLPRMEERLNAMILDTWGELSDNDKKILFSRECNVIQTTRALCSEQPPTPYGKKILCNGQIYHSVLATPSVKKVDEAATRTVN